MRVLSKAVYGDTIWKKDRSDKGILGVLHPKSYFIVTVLVAVRGQLVFAAYRAENTIETTGARPSRSPPIGKKTYWPRDWVGSFFEGKLQSWYFFLHLTLGCSDPYSCRGDCAPHLGERDALLD